jgi:hypothetical protein
MSKIAKEFKEKSKASVVQNTKCYREKISSKSSHPGLAALYDANSTGWRRQYEASDPG